MTCSEVRAWPAADFFSLAEALAEAEDRRAEWEAALAGMKLRR